MLEAAFIGLFQFAEQNYLRMAPDGFILHVERAERPDPRNGDY